MKHLLFFSFLTTLFSATAQTPDYFIPGMKWRIEDNSFWGNDYGYQTEYAMEYNGEDTVVGAYTYKILRQHGVTEWHFYGNYVPTNPMPANPQWFNSYLLVRQDGEQIYALHNSNVDTLVFDFHLQIGDTIRQTAYVNPGEDCDPVVTGIDSISILGSFRRVFHYHSSYSGEDGDYIEGIGTTNGFVDEYEMIACHFEQYGYLMCFAVNDTMYYPNYGPNTCVFNLGLKELSSVPLSVYPNPASDRITLQLPENVQVSTVEVIDLQGRRTQATCSSDATLDVSGLGAGSYVILVRTADGDMTAARFVKTAENY